MSAERSVGSEGGWGGNDSTQAGAAERLRFYLQWAVRAPSRNNTQPWIFEIAGDELLAYADASRALPQEDPDGRQLLMSCGAALLNLRLAAAHFGQATSLEIIPGHRGDGLVARLRLEERRSATPELEELFHAIPRRRTNRLPLDGREPPAGLVTALLREARCTGVSLRPVEPHQRRLVADLVAEGDDLAWASARFRAELAGWVRTSRSPRRDGLPGRALGMSDAAVLVHPLVARLRSQAQVEAERDRRRAQGTRALLVLSTRRDSEAQWIEAGEALQRVLLRATTAGLFASYFAQPIETPALRRRLAEAIGDPGAPQVMFRLGYGLEPPATPRRAVEDLLRRMDREREPSRADLALRTAPAGSAGVRSSGVAVPAPSLAAPPRLEAR